MKNIQIKALNMELTDALTEYVENKLSYLDKLIDPNDESVKCFVRIGRTSNHHQSGDVFKAELTLHTSGKNFGAESEKSDLYAAIDDLKDQVMRKMTSHKEKKQNTFRKGATKIKNILKGFKNNN